MTNTICATAGVERRQCWRVDNLSIKQLYSAACIATIIAGNPGAVLAEPERLGISSEPMTISDGAKAMVCEKIGFLAIVRDTDGTLVSPQFPHLDIQHSDQVFALTDADAELNGMKINYTSFLRFQQPDRWVFTGFDGTSPFVDDCRDITSDLAFSFQKIAVGASWGLAHVRERVELFDAFEDDMRTRLELTDLERQTLEEQNEDLRTQVTSLNRELDELRLAACNRSLRSGQLVFAAKPVASAETGDASPPGPLTFSNPLWDCVEDTVLVNFAGAE